MAEKTRKIDSELENEIIHIFKDSRNNYGSRKIKVELKKKNIIASRKKIRRIMDKYGLVSNYTIKQYKVHKSTGNNNNHSLPYRLISERIGVIAL